MKQAQTQSQHPPEEKGEGFDYSLSGIAEWFFAITRDSASVRVMVLVITFLMLWATFSISNTEIEPNATITTAIINLFFGFFAPSVLRRMLVIGVAGWLALRAASTYMDDIFELEDPTVATQFITQAALSTWYTNNMVIRDGQVEDRYKNSPIYRIGGPGFVQVHLENAALFEKIDGTPHVVGPGTKRVTLEGFERLRHVYDLRNQERDIEVSGRTRDGIKVTAKDVRVVFTVYRGSEANKKGNIYAYTEKALENLVYKQGNRLWVQSAQSSIEGAVRSFISQHSLGEFLSNVSTRELEDLEKPISSTTQTVVHSQSTEEKVTKPNFVARDAFTDRLYEFAQGPSDILEKRGFEVEWIGGGTWVPEEISIRNKLRQAWQKSTANQMKSTLSALSKERRDSRLSALMTLVQDIPLNTFINNISQRKSSEEVKRELLLAYREKIRNAYEYVKEHDAENSPLEDHDHELIQIQLQASLQHLSRLTDRWM